jgi:hypothetical protein
MRGLVLSFIEHSDAQGNVPIQISFHLYCAFSESGSRAFATIIDAIAVSFGVLLEKACVFSGNSSSSFGSPLNMRQFRIDGIPEALLWQYWCGL